jgi:hypothetical protein
MTAAVRNQDFMRSGIAITSSQRLRAPGRRASGDLRPVPGAGLSEVDEKLGDVGLGTPVTLTAARPDTSATRQAMSCLDGQWECLGYRASLLYASREGRRHNGERFGHSCTKRRPNAR